MSMEGQNLELRHIELKEANAFVSRLHRHHDPVRGHRFSLGAYCSGNLVGVAIVGRPVARMVDYTTTVEVVRLCTDGTKNACSFLYGASARAARALGYTDIITYTLESESGISLKAAGWDMDAVTGGGSWDCASRRRNNTAPTCPKKRWRKHLWRA